MKKVHHIAILVFISGLFFSACDANQKEEISVQNYNGIILLEHGKLSLAVDAYHGGKIISLKYDKTEMLTPKSMEPDYYGSSLWLSPFKKYWPQPVALDKAVYKIELISNGVRLISPLDKVNNLIYQKEYVLNNSIDGIEINYTVINTGNDTIGLAVWEVTRVPKDGTTFFPLGELNLDESRLIDSSVKSELSEGILWHHFTPENILQGKQKPKLYTDGSEGWIGYVHNNILLLKEFEDVPLINQAEGENEIELYVKDNLDYIEIENQGAYKNLEPGDSLLYKTQWKLIDIGDQDSYLNMELVKTVRTKLLTD